MDVQTSGLYPNISEYNIDGTTGTFNPTSSVEIFTAADHAKINKLFKTIKKDNIFQKLKKKEEAPKRAQEYFAPEVEKCDKHWYHRPTFTNYNTCYHTCYDHSFTIITLGSLHSESRRRSKDDDGMSRGTQVLLATVAAGVVATAFYFIGKAAAEIKNAGERKEIIKEYKASITKCDNLIAGTNLPQVIKDIFKAEVFAKYTAFLNSAKKAENSNISGNWKKVALLTIAAAGAVILAIGAVAASWPLALVGMGVVAVGALGMLAKWSFESGQSNEIQERAIQTQLDEIQEGEVEIEKAFKIWENQLSQIPSFNPDFDQVDPSAPELEEDTSEQSDYKDFLNQ